jgi:putative peptidoglycan lipid II flippase
MALFRRFATVSGFTGLSRILGFIRDILIANVVGTGPVADAFFVAFRLPNMFRRIFAEGAFNAAFVPLFAQHMERGGAPAARRFAEETFSVLLTTLLFLTGVALVAMPALAYLLGGGFANDPDPAKFELTIKLSRIAFPYLLFMALVALLSGVLNSLHRFAAAAAAPILLNVFFILALLVVLPFTDWPGEVMAWTVAVAGLAQFLLLAVAARRAGMALRVPRPRLTPDVRRFLSLMVPGVLSASVLQLNLLVGTRIASEQDGAVSYLYYADRVYQLPLGLIGIAIGIVLLPDLSRKIRGGGEQAAMHSLNRGIELSMLLTVPAAVALSVIPWPIIVVLFERGAFDRAASEATAAALAAFALGLPAYVLVKVLQPGFFARENMVTPFKISIVSVAVNIALAVLFFFQFRLGVVGLALATAIAAWVNVALLAFSLRRRKFLSLDTRNRGRLPRILLASLLMGALLWAGQNTLEGWFDAGFWVGVGGLVLLVGGGLVAYGLLALLLGAVAPAELRALRPPRP